MSTQWFYVQNGQRIGPVTLEQVKAVLAAGDLPQEALVWNQGLPGWVAAHTLPELAPAPPVAPPPPQPFPQPFPAPAPFAAPMPQPMAAPPQSNPYGGSPQIGLSYGSQPGPDTGGSIPPMAIQLLKQTRPWVRFLGVLGFIHLAFMVVGALSLMAMSATNRVPILPSLAGGAAYFVMAALALPAVLSLHRYASRITDLERNGQHRDLEAALAAQKGFWKYVGILGLIGLCLALLGIVLAFVLGAGLLSHL